jgi:hypothetical protein
MHATAGSSQTTSASTHIKQPAAPFADGPLAKDFLRYWLAAYTAVILPAAVGLLLGAGAMILGGVGTTAGDLLFGIGAVVGFLVGCIPGVMLMTAICPKEPPKLQSVRQGALGAGSFFCLPIMLFSGFAIVAKGDALLLTTIKIAVFGGIFSSLGATLFMAYQDRKYKADKRLLYAVEMCDTGMVESVLQEHPTLVFQSDDDRDTPLHLAASQGRSDVVALLLTNKALVDAKDKYGIMPLHLAAIHGHRDVAELLLAHKADINPKSNDGSTPLHLAVKNGRTDVAELLRQHAGHE